jgi:hypothetical protein
VKIWPAVVDLSESVAYVTELPAGEVVPASCAPCDAATESRFLRSQDSTRVFSSGDKSSFVASGSSSLQKYTNVPNPHLLQN